MKKELFAELHNGLKKQRFWLDRSRNICSKLDIKNLSVEEFDSFETLSSRFARTIDFLVRKYWRAIDTLEFENQGTLIDVVNRAEKRNFFENIEEFREMKDIRNEIVHEYLDDDLKPIFEDIRELSEKLLEIIDKSLKYGEQYI